VSRKVDPGHSICTALPFQRAYHTPLFAQFAQRWAELHRHTTFRAPEIDLYSCATASRYPFEPEAIRRLAAEQWARPVRFRETVEAMYAAGVRIFVEVGPKGILTGFVRDILRGRPHAAVASNLPHRSGMSQLNHLVAELGAHGIPLKLGHWYNRTPPAVPPEKGAAGVAPGWPDPGSGSDTSRVMREYLATMDRVLDLQEEFMRSYLRRAAPALSASPAPPLPFGGPIVSMTPGVGLVMQRALDPCEDLFLRDHTLGGRVSGPDEGLLALPVLPLTMSMEILAEAAATLVPGKVVLGMREVRASSWLALDDGPLVLTVGAHLAQEGEVLVRIWPQAGGGDGRHTAPAVEGTVLLGEAPPRACAPQMDGPRVTHPSRWTPDALYGEFMFHGPAFQAVTSIRHSDQRGMEAVLTAPSAEGLFRSSPAPQLLALPVLLDAAGQLVGFWTAEHEDRAAHVFPFRVEGLQIFGPAPPPGTLVTCRAAISRVGEWELRTDMELIGPGGDLLARIDGWWDKRFDLPEPLYRLGSSPRDHAVATPVPLPTEAGPSACSLVDAFGPELLESHGRIWQRVMAHLILGRNEREVWNRLPGSQERRSGWLLGRAAAKDAVRRLLLQSRGIVAYPAEIEITNDRNGRPQARGPWCAALDEPLFVSLAHAGGLAVALAVLGGGRPGVGIDLERVRPLAEGFDGVAFAPEEHAILSAVDPADETQWRVRLWCAKEAVGKALGTGLADGPRGLVVRRCDLVTGCVEVEPAQAAPSAAGRPHGLVALTTCADGLALALCLGRAPADV
jgi:phosphopantetheinyl transferase/malonyl CoA-acyl carrier protein transacylase